MRKLRIVLGITLLLISCALLAWGFWPVQRERHVLPISPSEMTLPTPAGSIPGLEAGG